MANPIVHFEIASRDTGKVRDFYSKLFGWPINADNPMNYGLARTKEGELGIDGGLYQAEDPNDRPGVRLYAQVDDAQAFLEKAASLGGTVAGEAQEVPGQGIKVGQFLDPEGNIFGVVQPLQG